MITYLNDKIFLFGDLMIMGMALMQCSIVAGGAGGRVEAIKWIDSAHPHTQR